MTDSAITFPYVWGLAAAEEARRATYLTVYGPSATTQREQRGFARICELLALLEANEREFMAYLQAKRKKQSDDNEESGEGGKEANPRKQKARVS